MTHQTLRQQLLRLMVAAATILGLFLGNGPRDRPAQAANGTVGNGFAVSCTAGALQSVLNLVQSSGGGLIDFKCGALPHTIVVTATLQITSTVAFDGGALGDITLSGGDARRVFINQGGALSLTDMVVAHGKVADGFGGCILNSLGTLSLLRSVVQICQSGPGFPFALSRPAAPNGSASSGGGAIYNNNGVVTLQNTEVLTSNAESGGGIQSFGSLSLTGSRLAGNTARDFGGGLAATGAITIVNSLVEHNASLSLAGGIGGTSSTQITLAGSRVYSNTSVTDAGGIYSQDVFTATNTRIEENAAGGNGGGLFIQSGTTSIDHDVMVGNRAVALGGGVYSVNTLALTATQVLSNFAGNAGGGAYSGGAMWVTGGLFQANRAAAGGGGGLFSGGQLRLTGTDFIGNTSFGDGGGAWTIDLAKVSGGLFRNNTCLDGGCYGGGLATYNSLAMTGTQFISNSAGSRGGGVFESSAILNGGLFQDNTCRAGDCRGGGLVANTVDLTATQFINNASAGNGGAVHADSGRLVNALFARNSAAGNGAALYFAGVGVTSILHNTIAGPPPFGSAGAAIHVFSGTVGVTNTIVASYTIGISRTNGTVSEDYNLFFNTPAATVGGVASGGHSFSGNPAFAGPAQDDYHLRAGSAAIDQGVNAGVAQDVDGDSRPLFAGFDIGFDEFARRLLFLPLVLR